MPVVARPRASRSAVAAALGLTLVLSVGASATPASAHEPRRPPAPPALQPFMEALAAVESGGRYDARNRTSGAYGRYQIMPANWPSWAHWYLGTRRAKPTPANQDRVAAGRLSDLYRRFDAWDRVAYWWLTGRSGPRVGWSDYASRYVRRVMLGYRTNLASPGPGQARRTLDDRSAAIRYSGTWVTARHRAYLGDGVHASPTAGDRLVIRFTGRSIRLVGPVGPTRGGAAVYVDGKRVRTIDLRARRFDPVRVLFTATWGRRGTHRVVVEVLGTRGRPMVALDRVVVGR